MVDDRVWGLYWPYNNLQDSSAIPLLFPRTNADAVPDVWTFRKPCISPFARSDIPISALLSAVMGRGCPSTASIAGTSLGSYRPIRSFAPSTQSRNFVRSSLTAPANLLTSTCFASISGFGWKPPPPPMLLAYFHFYIFASIAFFTPTAGHYLLSLLQSHAFPTKQNLILPNIYQRCKLYRY